MSTLRKNVFVERLAHQTGREAHEISELLTTFFEEVAASTARGDRIALHHFGTFQSHKLPSRRGRNPRTGQLLEIAESRTVRFHPGKRLRERVQVPADVRRILEREPANLARPVLKSALEEGVAAPTAAPARRCRVLCVGGGKGGTGKSVLTSNLALFFARRSLRVTALDADLGLGNLHLLMNVAPRYNLLHVVREEKRFSEVVEVAASGVQLVCGGSGITSLAMLRSDEIYRILRGLHELEESSDVLLVDTAAGLSPRTLIFLRAATEIVVVTGPDITAMTDAYATMKTVLRSNPRARLRLVVNQARSAEQGDEVFRKIDSVTRKFLEVNLQYLGSVAEDPAVVDSVRRRSPVLVSSPESRAARDIEAIGERLVADDALTSQSSQSVPFTARLTGVLVGHA